MSGELGAVVYAAELNRMVAFYEGVLGLVLEQAGDGFAMLGCGDTVVTLVQIPPHIAATFEIADPPERREDTPIKLSFVVPSIAAAREAAAALGGVVDGVDSEWDFGPVRVCDGHDPEGNVIQVRQRAE
jgi:catechol 2,3-dioxygenase-like lactoylglutathione lyase family enzyme